MSSRADYLKRYLSADNIFQCLQFRDFPDDSFSDLLRQLFVEWEQNAAFSKLSQFLKFVTGLDGLPLNSEFGYIKVICMEVDKYPESHTCFNKLVIMN